MKVLIGEKYFDGIKLVATDDELKNRDCKWPFIVDLVYVR
jgi:hypothetical protein